MPRKLPYKSGDIYGDVILTGKSFYKPNDFANYVEALCVCGKLFYTRLSAIKSSHSTSCGCKRINAFLKRNTIHGLCIGGNKGVHPLYSTWYAVKKRCYSPKYYGYKDYGGRGIKVCDEWLKDFFSFFNWAIKNGWARGLSLDRIENNGDYEPSNCRWATSIEQMKHTRRSVFITAFNETKIMSDWEDDDRCKVSQRTFSARIKKGWDAESAMTTRKRL